MVDAENARKIPDSFFEALAPGAEPRDLIAVLQKGLHTLTESTGRNADLERLLNLVIARAAEDRLSHRVKSQKAYFISQRLREQMALDRRQDRLTGSAAALNRVLAQAMKATPRRVRKALFDTGAYLRQNPDVAAAGVDPLKHYLTSGAQEGRAPGDLLAQGNDHLPFTLAALCQSTTPCFSEELPSSVRAEALRLMQASRPRISVVIPSWNRAHVVTDAVSSALLQSLAALEVIVVDDGSTDGTAALLEARFAEACAAGALVVLRRPHGGVSTARNAGLDQARGDIIAYLDSDNSWEPDHLLFACAGLLLDPEADCAYTALCRHNISDGWSDILFRPYDRTALERDNYIDLNSFVHHRHLFETHGGFDTALTRLVDWDLILRYTAGTPPAALAVVTGHYVLEKDMLGNITATEDAAPNVARIRAKQGRA